MRAKGLPRGPLEGNVSPRDMFIATALIFPVFILQRDPGIRILQTFAFLILNAVFGRRMGILSILFAAVSITAFHLVIPSGRVFASIAGIPLTEGALRSGIMKSTAVIGMTAISRLSIWPDLRFPGRLGGIIARSFFYFQRIMNGKKSISRKDPIAGIDRLLSDAHHGSGEGRRRSAPRRTTSAGFFWLAVAVTMNWAALIFSVAKPGIFLTE